MDKNKFIYCTLLLIDEYNHSRIFISEKIGTTLDAIIIQYTYKF